MFSLEEPGPYETEKWLQEFLPDSSIPPPKLNTLVREKCWSCFREEKRKDSACSLFGLMRGCNHKQAGRRRGMLSVVAATGTRKLKRPKARWRTGRSNRAPEKNRVRREEMSANVKTPCYGDVRRCHTAEEQGCHREKAMLTPERRRSLGSADFMQSRPRRGASY